MVRFVSEILLTNHIMTFHWHPGLLGGRSKSMTKKKYTPTHFSTFANNLQTHTDTPPKPLVALAGNRHSYHSYHSHHPSTCIRGKGQPTPKNPNRHLFMKKENPFIFCILEYQFKNILGVCFKEISQKMRIC